MSIMQEQKMIDESLLLRYFEKEVSEEEKQKVEEWIRSSEANSRMAKQVAQIFVATRLLHNSYLQPIITQYFIDNKSEIWLLFLIAHSKR